MKKVILAISGVLVATAAGIGMISLIKKKQEYRHY